MEITDHPTPTRGKPGILPDSINKIGIFAGTPFMKIRGSELLTIQTSRFLSEYFPDASIDLIFPVSASDKGRVIEGTFFSFMKKYFGTSSRNIKIWTPVVSLADSANFNSLIQDLSLDYDIYVNTLYGSDHPARGKFNVYYCMFPFDLEKDKNGNRDTCKSKAFLSDYHLFLAISAFTQEWIKTYWHVDSYVVYPPPHIIESPYTAKKENTIINIGRFALLGNIKRQDVLIDAFIRIYDSGKANGWKLQLIGYLNEYGPYKEFIDKLKEKARGYPIEFFFSIRREELVSLLSKSKIYWHATGYGTDLISEPYKAEHFGISIVEAMFYGGVPLVFNGGGQPEIIEDGVSGYVWNRPDDLIRYSRNLMHNQVILEKMSKAAKMRSGTFSYLQFAKTFASYLPINRGNLSDR